MVFDRTDRRNVGNIHINTMGVVTIDWSPNYTRGMPMKDLIAAEFKESAHVIESIDPDMVVKIADVLTQNSRKAHTSSRASILTWSSRSQTC